MAGHSKGSVRARGCRGGSKRLHWPRCCRYLAYLTGGGGGGVGSPSNLMLTCGRRSEPSQFAFDCLASFLIAPALQEQQME